MDPRLPDLQVLRRCWPAYADPGRTFEVAVRGARFGGAKPVLVAGPCAVESFEQTLAVARCVQALGIPLLRGGAFKPRTSPYSFQGLGTRGLEILSEVRARTGLGIVTEVLDPRLVEHVAGFADMLQIGSRSMQNFPLLVEVGRSQKPVLLKRGWSATLEEWLCAAEYIVKEGNHRVVLCERGVRAACHGEYARAVLDLNVIEPLRQATPLPVIVDPSHATGHWSLVEGACRAALAAGAHGLLIEAIDGEDQREKLRCDAQNAVPPDMLASIVRWAERGSGAPARVAG